MLRTILIILLVSTSAFAQQQPLDPIALQRAVQVLQQQRNAALDQAATAGIQLLAAQEEITKLHQEIAALKAEKKPAQGPGQ